MKNKIILVLAAIILLGSGGRAQAPVLYYYETVPAGGTVANCPAVISGATAWCTVFTGKYQSINDAAWTLMTAPTSTGVASLTVCNASGSSCGPAQTGTVTIDVPKAATVTTTATTTATSNATLQ